MGKSVLIVSIQLEDFSQYSHHQNQEMEHNPHSRNLLFAPSGSLRPPSFPKVTNTMMSHSTEYFNMFNPVIIIHIYFFHATSLWDPPILLHVVVTGSFSLLHKVPLCKYTIIYLCYLLLLSSWIVSSLGLLQITVLWTSLHKSSGKRIYTFLLCIYQKKCWVIDMHILYK